MTNVVQQDTQLTEATHSTPTLHTIFVIHSLLVRSSAYTFNSLPITADIIPNLSATHAKLVQRSQARPDALMRFSANTRRGLDLDVQAMTDA